MRLQFTSGQSSYIDEEVNSTFGEFAGDTRVAQYHSFISSVLNGDTPGDRSDDGGKGGSACPPAKQAKGKC